MNKAQRFIKVILSLLLLVFLLPSPIQAQVSSGVSNLQTDVEDNADAESYAREYNVSVEEALYRFKIQNLTGELDAQLSEKESETFAGLWLEHTPEFKVVVLFTQDDQKMIEPYLSEELTDLIEVRTAKKSLAELQKIQEEYLTSIRDAKIPVAADINIFENSIKIYVEEKDRNTLENVLQNNQLIIPDYIQIITVPELEATEAGNIYGGLPLTRSNGTLPCTSGFTVQDANGKRGILTAGHCTESSNTRYYNGSPLPYMTFTKFGSLDVGWHSTPGFTVTNQFQVSTSGTLRRVYDTKSRNLQAVGGYVCKFGNATNYTCGSILSKYYRPPTGDVPSSLATFMLVNNSTAYPDLSSGGDSGAPWFNSNTADDPNDAVYMAINYIDGLGVSVVINPVFGDVYWDHWAWQEIERLYNSHITGGCSTSPLNYCPNNNATRAEMAVFLLRGIHGAGYTPPAVGGSTDWL